MQDYASGNQLEIFPQFPRDSGLYQIMGIVHQVARLGGPIT